MNEKNFKLYSMMNNLDNNKIVDSKDVLELNSESTVKNKIMKNKEIDCIIEFGTKNIDRDCISKEADKLYQEYLRKGGEDNDDF